MSNENNVLKSLLQYSQISYGKNYEEVFSDVITYLQTIDPRWNNLSETDAGVMIIHAITYLTALNNYHLDRSVQELHPDYASEDSSKYSIANFLGYRRSSISASAGVVRMHLSSNSYINNHKLLIPKYFSFTTKGSDGNAVSLSASEELIVDLEKLDSLKVKIKDYDYSVNTTVHPEIYLLVKEGSISSFNIVNPGSGLEVYSNNDHNILAYCDANPDLQIVLVERSGLIDSVILNSDYMIISENEGFNSDNPRLMLPSIDIPVVEGTPSVVRISSNQINNDEYNTGLLNIDLSMIELYDNNNNLWTLVDNVLYEYDQYGLNPRKYSVRINSENSLVLEFNTTWRSQISESSYSFKLKYLVSHSNPIDLIDNTEVKPYEDIQLLTYNGGISDDYSLSMIHVNSKVSTRVYGGSGLKSSSEDLLLARVQSRMMKTIVTVPDLAGAVRGFRSDLLSAAADINDDKSVKDYIADQLGRNVDTYEMYYTVVTDKLVELDSNSLSLLNDKLYRYKHIFTKGLIYVRPEIITLDLDVTIYYDTDYEDQYIHSNAIQIINSLFSTDYDRYKFNMTPSDSEVMSAVHRMSGSVKNVKIKRTYGSESRHLFSIVKLNKLNIKTIKYITSENGGYKYEGA